MKVPPALEGLTNCKDPPIAKQPPPYKSQKRNKNGRHGWITHIQNERIKQYWSERILVLELYIICRPHWHNTISKNNWLTLHMPSPIKLSRNSLGQNCGGTPVHLQQQLYFIFIEYTFKNAKSYVLHLVLLHENYLRYKVCAYYLAQKIFLLPCQHCNVM